MGTPFMLSPATLNLGGATTDDGAENPLFGDEEVHSVVDRVHANTPRAVYFEPDPERDAADMKIWAVLKTRSWGSQLATLCAKGWVEPEPSYADLESQLARRVFVMEHGFGRVAKVEKTKRGFKPSSIEFVDGGRKVIVLRAQGKEMGTPWLISPALEPISAYQDLLDAHSTPSKKSSSVKTVEPPATPEQDRADRQQWSSLQSLGGWGKQLAALKKDGWVEPDPDYNTIDQNLGDRLFVMDLGFGKLVKVEQKKRGWGPCKIDFAEGGEKLVILRLLGKEMGTPFLVQSNKRALSVTVASPAGSVTIALTPQQAKKDAKALKAKFVELLPSVPKSNARVLAMQAGKAAALALSSKDYVAAVEHLHRAVAHCEGQQQPGKSSTPVPVPEPEPEPAPTKPSRSAPLPPVLHAGDPESPVETRSKFTYDEESENPLHGDETVHGIVDRHHAATVAAGPLVTDADDDGAENPLFGDEEVHSVVDRVHANTPRAVYFEPDPERDAADMKIWAVLKTRSWGSQLATLC
eukprot:COSAG02_NODE_5321_length_4439_cov_5.402765_1_plen_522_part_10